MKEAEELAKYLVEHENFASEEQAMAFLEEVKEEVLSLIINELYYKSSLLEDFAEKLENYSTDDFLANMFTTYIGGIFFDTYDISDTYDWNNNSDEDAMHVDYISDLTDAVEIQFKNDNIQNTFKKYLKTLMRD